MEFNQAYNVDVIVQFFCTVYIDTDDHRTMYWMTEGKRLKGTWAQFVGCLGYPVLEDNEEGYFRVHLSKKPIEKKELLADLYMPGNVEHGKIKFLKPVYDILMRIFREVLNPKVGCQHIFFGFLQNLLLLTHQHRGTGLQLDVMDYIWNELWNGILSRKAPVYAPYLMRFICMHWNDLGHGQLIGVVQTFPHKARELKIKTHTPPARLAADKGKSVVGSAGLDGAESSSMANSSKGMFARLEAKLLKIFCLKTDMHKR